MRLFGWKKEAHTMAPPLIDPEIIRASAEETRKLRGEFSEKVIELDRERNRVLHDTIGDTLDSME